MKRTCVAVAYGLAFLISPFSWAQNDRQLGARHLPPVLPKSSWDQNRRIELRFQTFHLTTNFVVAGVEIGSDVPDRIAIVVKQKEPRRAAMTSPNPALDQRTAVQKYWDEIHAREKDEQVDCAAAQWIAYRQTVPIDLGPGDGARTVWIAAEWQGAQFASGTRVEVIRTPPTIVITNPAERVTSQPIIQFQGYSERPLQSLRFDVINASNRVENEQAFVNSQVIDLDTVALCSTNYFTAYDVALSVGTNVINLRCEDLAGNIATNSYTYILDLEHDKTAPLISPKWPSPRTKITGPTFTAQGQLDDPTARIVGYISGANGQAVVEGTVERNGYFWLRDFPLSSGNNSLTLTATDAAGNSASTNFSVMGTKGSLVMDAIPPEQLWWGSITVTGKVDPPNQAVWINSVQANVRPDGTWIATNVPVISPGGGGIASFEMTAVPSGEEPPAGAKPATLISAQASLKTNNITLNPSLPACGTFQLHLTDTAGRGFVLQASTNLIDWTPILTNLNSEATFDYVDTNAGGRNCRFFKVIPGP